ncbi:Pam17-domain-containing protein [Poronia punctata]|nr:Pam17-domain-containing protein [Poronia punctata]
MLAPTATATTARFASLTSRGLQLQTAFARGTICPYSSLASLARQPCVSPKQIVNRNPISYRRSASTASTAGSTTSSSASSPESHKQLDWNTFFKLRKTRRRIQLVSSIVTMAAGGTTGAVLLVNMNMESLLSKVPLDPFFSLGIITLSFAGLGWLAGPVLGSALFHMYKSGVKRPMAIKESEFFNRIKKHRVDPSNSSLSGNAVPDFYGEKISSVAGYRQWLKDQRAFNKKKTSFV